MIYKSELSNNVKEININQKLKLIQLVKSGIFINYKL